MQARESQENETVSVFISYHHSDGIIAAAIRKALKEINRTRVKCFLDTKEIKSGRPWEDDLTRALKAADWLICIYTGEQSDYCGYEVGVFSESHGLRISANPDSRVVCLHDVRESPSIFHAHQNRFIQFPPEKKSVGFDEKKFYLESELAKFLSDFHSYKHLYVEEDALEGVSQEELIARHAKEITDAFKQARSSDLKWEKFIQLRIELRIVNSGSDEFPGIPEDAEVSGDNETFSLFNVALPPEPDGSRPKTAWCVLREAQDAVALSTSWMDAVERDVVAAANNRARSRAEAEVTFQRGERIFRPVLSRHAMYEDGSRTFSIQFIETLPRQFLGKRDTSLILAGVILASRFRFAYFETGEGEYERRFSDDVSDRQFAINCRQLRYDIERMEHESAEFGLLDRQAFIAAFGEKHRAAAEDFVQNWQVLKAELFTVLPSRALVPADRPRIRDGVAKFFKLMKWENAAFLDQAIEVYHEEMSAQLRPILAGAKQ
ncbi:MAG: toll/interleukin-1 receptor domain-containing protein [Verrucomicrobia bacterium]|nr:toll/interleukin-1 receptor domain-containing protein [Verrucomicrobiota bacterium]